MNFRAQFYAINVIILLMSALLPAAPTGPGTGGQEPECTGTYVYTTLPNVSSPHHALVDSKYGYGPDSIESMGGGILHQISYYGQPTNFVPNMSQKLLIFSYNDLTDNWTSDYRGPSGPGAILNGDELSGSTVNIEIDSSGAIIMDGYQFEGNHQTAEEYMDAECDFLPSFQHCICLEDIGHLGGAATVHYPAMQPSQDLTYYVSDTDEGIQVDINLSYSPAEAKTISFTDGITSDFKGTLLITQNGRSIKFYDEWVISRDLSYNEVPGLSFGGGEISVQWDGMFINDDEEGTKTPFDAKAPISVTFSGRFENQYVEKDSSDNFFLKSYASDDPLVGFFTIFPKTKEMINEEDPNDEEAIVVSESDGASPGDAAADPVNMYTGEYYTSNVDLFLQGDGADFVWSRTHRSNQEKSKEVVPQISTIGNVLRDSLVNRPPTNMEKTLPAGWSFNFNTVIKEYGYSSSRITVRTSTIEPYDIILYNDVLDNNHIVSRPTLDLEGRKFVLSAGSRKDYFSYDSTNEVFVSSTHPKKLYVTLEDNDASPYYGSPSEMRLESGSGAMTFFNQRGCIDYIQARNGNRITVTYDDDELIDYIADTVGRHIDFQYVLDIGQEPDQKILNKIVVYSDSGLSNILQEIEYDNNNETTRTGTLFSFTRKFKRSSSGSEEDSRIRYYYDAEDRINQVVGPDDNLIIDNTYGDEDFEDGRVISQIWGGDLVSIKYEDLGNNEVRTTIFDRERRVHILEYDASGRPKSHIQKEGIPSIVFAGDPMDSSVVSYTMNAGIRGTMNDRTTEFGWDWRGRRRYVENPDGTSQLFVYADDLAVPTDIYSKNNVVQTWFFPAGYTAKDALFASIDNNEIPDVQAFLDPVNGNTTLVDPNGSFPYYVPSDPSVQAMHYYYVAGSTCTCSQFMAARRDSRGNLTRYERDPQDENFVSRIYNPLAEGLTAPQEDDHAIILEYYGLDSIPADLSHPDYGLLKTVSYPPGDGSTRREDTYTWDKGQLATVTVGSNTSMPQLHIQSINELGFIDGYTDPDGNQTVMELNEFGMPLSVTKPDLGNTYANPVTDFYEYNGRGLVTKLIMNNERPQPVLNFGGTDYIWKSTWSSGEVYSIGDAVVTGGSVYHCIADHTSDGNNSPVGGGGSSFWVFLSSGSVSDFDNMLLSGSDLSESPNQILMEYDYNNLGKLASIKYHDAPGSYFTRVYNYNANDELISTHLDSDESNSSYTESELDSVNNRVSYVYDSLGRLYRYIRGPEVTDQSSITFDNSRYIAQLDYDSMDRVTKYHIGGPPGDPGTRTNTILRDSSGRPFQRISPNGLNTLYSYHPNSDLLASLLKLGHPEDDTQILPGDLPLLEYHGLSYDKLNRIDEYFLSHLDPKAHLDDILAAQPGSPVLLTNLGVDGYAYTEYRYHPNQTIDKVSRLYDFDEDIGDFGEFLYSDIWSYEYDDLYRVSSTTDPENNTDEYTWDSDNNLTNVESTTWSESGLANIVTNTSLTYDNWDRVLTVTAPGSRTTSYGYTAAGLVSQMTDPTGNFSEYSYDGLGRIHTSRHATKNLLDGNYATSAVVNDYDPYNRLVSKTDPFGDVTNYDYDHMNRITDITYPDGSDLSVDLYNQFNEIILSHDANGNYFYNIRDDLGRTFERQVHSGGSFSTSLNGTTNLYEASFTGSTLLDTETYLFDSRSFVTKAEDNDSIVERVFDTAGFLMTETQTHKNNGNQSYTIDYTVDNRFDETGINYPGGGSVSRAFDALGRPESMAFSGGHSLGLDYQGKGLKIDRMQFIDSTTVEAELIPQYDISSRIPSRFTWTDGPGTLNVLADIDVGYDDVLNKTSRTDFFANPSASSPERVQNLAMNYDGFNRMDSITETLSQTLGGTPNTSSNNSIPLFHDSQLAVEDRTGLDGRDYTIRTDGSHEIEYIQLPTAATTDHKLQLTHDANGNRTSFNDNILLDDGNGGWILSTSGTSRSYGYDHRNQLTSYSDSVAAAPGNSATYAYDAFGRRIHKRVYATIGNILVEEKWFVYDGHRVIEERGDNPELSGTGTFDLLAEYYYGNYIDELVHIRRFDQAAGGAATSYHVLRDEQYNIVALQGADGAGNPIVERVVYGPFGSPRFFDESTGTQTARSTHGLDHAFHGRRWDWESGLYHFRTRAYDPVSNRFLQRDSIGIWGDGLNLGNGYTFVGSNPWSMVDPYGEQGISFAGGGGYGNPNPTFWEENADWWDNQVWEPCKSRLTSADAGVVHGAGYVLVTFGQGFTDFQRLGNGSAGAYEGYDPNTGEKLTPTERALGGLEDVGRAGTVAGAGGGLLGVGDDAARLADDVIRASDDVARSADDAARVTDDIIDATKVSDDLCLVEGTLLHTSTGLVPIEDLRPGDRVLTSNPDSSFSGEIDKTELRLVRIEMKDSEDSDGFIEFEFILSRDWIEQNVIDSKIVYLDIEEIGSKGWARVVSIDQCPELSNEPGKLVLGRVTQLSVSLLRFSFRGTDTVLELTQSHPLFSEKDQDWKAAESFKEGDLIRTVDGSIEIFSVVKIHDKRRVYNISVDEDFHYIVSDQAILSHNMGKCMTDDQVALKDLVDEMTNNGTKPLDKPDAETILDWADGIDYPNWRASPNDLASPNPHYREPHIHLPGTKKSHVPVDPGVTPPCIP